MKKLARKIKWYLCGIGIKGDQDIQIRRYYGIK